MYAPLLKRIDEKTVAGMEEIPTFAFYKELCVVELLVPPEAQKEEGLEKIVKPFSNNMYGDWSKEMFYCFSLHTQLFPPAIVERGVSSSVNEEHYCISLSNDDGFELLRYNWDLLLHLLFPVKASDEEMKSRASSACNFSQALEALPDGSIVPVIRGISCHPSLRFGLSAEEIHALQEPAMLDRIHFSYVAFLRFFGWKLHDDTRGEVDRHRGFASRYSLLRPSQEGRMNQDMESAPTSSLESSEIFPHQYHLFDFYESGIPRIIDCMLSIEFYQYAIRLVEFMIEEIIAGRLVFLFDLIEKILLPRLVECSSVDQSHISRLTKKLKSIVESDSE